MYKGLFNKEDNESLAANIQELQRAYSHQQTEAIEIIEQDQLNEKVQQNHIAELNKITHISQLKNFQGQEHYRKVYFTTGKGKFKLDLDTSALRPSPSVMLSFKAFEANYTKQLESMIYNDKDELDAEKLIGLIHMVSVVKNTKDLIQVKSNKFSRTLPVIVKCINAFFVKNRSVIFGMEQMFNGMSSQEASTPEQLTG